jgi:hypothetical protein
MLPCNFYTQPNRGKKLLIIHMKSRRLIRRPLSTFIQHHDISLDDLTNIDMRSLPRLGIRLVHITWYPDPVAGTVEVPRFEGVH